MASLPLPDTAPNSAPPRRAYWLRTLYQWHWLSSAACLVALVGFAVTGFTLNHAGTIEGRPRVAQRDATLPPALLDAVRARRRDGATLPSPVVDWLADAIGVRAGGRPGEWSDQEVYVPLPRPGGDAWVSIALDSGQVRSETTDRGWIAYFNDLHKGRNAGAAWRWFVDVFAAACLLFALTGLCLLYFHGRGRPSTWPMVGLGVVLPLILLLLFVH